MASEKGDRTRKKKRRRYPKVLRCSTLTIFVCALVLAWFSIDIQYPRNLNSPVYNRVEHADAGTLASKARLETLQHEIEVATGNLEAILGKTSASKSDTRPFHDGIYPMLSAPVRSHENTISSIVQDHPDPAPNTNEVVELPNHPVKDDQTRFKVDLSKYRNPIMYMTEEQLHNTPLDEMLAMYGPSLQSVENGRRAPLGSNGNGGGSCDSDFGVHLADRWRSAAKPCCHSNIAEGTSLTCHLVQQTRHHGAGDQLMYGENVQISFSDLVRKEGTVPKKYFTDYVRTKHNQEYSKIKWSKGTMAGVCQVDESNGWKREYFPGWNLDWFNAFEETESLACDVWMDNPTLIVERDTFANFFHNSEDFFNTFLALAILQWPIDGLQVLIADIFPKGPFYPIWSKVFRGGNTSPEPLTAFELARKYGSKKICFKKLAVAILGAAAPITVASWDTKCRAVALVRAYSDFVVRSLGLQNVNKGRHRLDVNVTYVARRASVEWPEKAFCDTEGSYFDCRQLEHLQIRKLGRMIKNDKDVVAGLRTLESKTYKNGARVHFRDVDFGRLTFEEQIAIDATTDLMIGPHGAGLMHNIFMPDRGSLIELFVDGSSANRHFHNLAFWAGHTYHGEAQGNPVNVGRLVRMAMDAIESLDLSDEAW